MLSFSNTSLSFLDVNVICKNQRLYTELYTKKADRNTLLRYERWDPWSVINSIPCSQMVRVKRIVDAEDKMENKSTEGVP